MRRRRKFKGTWFPTQYTVPDTEAENLSVVGFDLALAAGQTPQLDIRPLTFDSPNQGEHVTSDYLSTIIGNEWTLRRIVGNVFCNRNTQLQAAGANILNDSAPSVLAAAGIFVARADEANTDLPIGGADRNAYGPFDPDVIREPWLWRRTWILGSAGSAPFAALNTLLPQYVGPVFTGGGNPQVTSAFYPCSNVYYGTALTGPYIDSKVGRRIRQDERLYMAFSAVYWPIGEDTAINTQVDWHVDYRIYGALRRARNKSAF